MAENTPTRAQCSRCGVLNYDVGYRDTRGDFQPISNSFYGLYFDPAERASDYQLSRVVAEFFEDQFAPDKLIVIVLAADDNGALCQACHRQLRPYQARRRQKKATHGQQSPFDVEASNGSHD